MSRKLCEICSTRPVHAQTLADTGRRFCWECNTEAEWENTHSDDGHDELIAKVAEHGGETPSRFLDTGEQYVWKYMTECWMCHPELNEAHAEYVAPKKGHTNGVAKTYSSHKACTHPSTPKHRELCRRERAKNS
jgi:hypothetical protein